MRHSNLITACAAALALIACGGNPEELDGKENGDPQSAQVQSALDTSKSYIPIVLVLYEGSSYGGRKRYLIEDTHHFVADINFNDVASSALVLKGPNYDDYVATFGREPTVTLYTAADYGGSPLTLKVGGYTSFQGFNDAFSSARFNVSFAPTPPSDPSVQTISNIHTVVKLYNAANFGSYHVLLLGTSTAGHGNMPNFVSDFGFNDLASSVQAFKGPNWNNQNQGMALYTAANYGGSSLFVHCTSSVCDSRNFGSELVWNDVLSSSLSGN